ncbi:MAG: hypothetical protein GY940_19560 [bacterium]|nr:hypothetical protein [bacterium]
MKKRVLIIRSVSFQQLDKNLNAIVKRFPADEFQFHLLTHSHGIERARTYSALSEIVDYESRKNFTPFHVPRRLRKNVKNQTDHQNKSSYEAIIVPVTNQTGTGFLNVLAMTLRIPARSIYICNMVSDIREISRKKVLAQVAKSSLFSCLAALITLPVAVLGLPLLLFSLGKRKEGKRLRR